MKRSSVFLLARILNSAYALLDSVEAQLFWMLKFAKENNVPKERLDSLSHLMSRTRAALQEIYAIKTMPSLSDAFIHPKPSDEDSTAPRLWCCYTLGTWFLLLQVGTC